MAEADELIREAVVPPVGVDMNQPMVFQVPSVASGEYRISKSVSIGSGVQGGSVRIYARLRVDG